MRISLFDRLSRLIVAAGWLWFQGRRGPEGRRIISFSSLIGFGEDRQRTSVINATFDDDTRVDFDRAVQPLFSEAVPETSVRGQFTRLRRELIDDATWYAGPMFAEHLDPADLDGFLVSIYPPGTHVWSGIFSARAAGDGAFSSRERALVHLILNRVDRLHREGTDTPAHEDSLVELATRPRQVLLHLINGDSAKQIAVELGLSVHTVNDHLKTIRQHFGVVSRTQLMARFIAGASVERAEDASPAARPPAPGD